jgi:hypothetical protein
MSSVCWHLIMPIFIISFSSRSNYLHILILTACLRLLHPHEKYYAAHFRSPLLNRWHIYRNLLCSSRMAGSKNKIKNISRMTKSCKNTEPPL